MRVTRLQQVLLLSGLLLALPVAQAKKPDSDDGYRNGADYGRDADTGRGERRGKEKDKRYADEEPRRERREDSRQRNQQPERDYEPRRSDNRGYDVRPQPRGISLSDAVSDAERRTGGRVLSADPREENGELYYRVKVLSPDGRVQILYIDAR